MENTIEKVGGVIVLTVPYEALDAESAKDFQTEFESSIEDGATVVLDFSSVEFVDSAGLGVLVAALKTMHSTGGHMRVCGLHKPVHALFELVRMHRLVDIFKDREEALAS